MKVMVDVTSSAGLAGIIANPLLLVIVAAGLIGGVYYTMRIRKNRKNP
jgi:hypothetical protein